MDPEGLSKDHAAYNDLNPSSPAGSFNFVNWSDRLNDDTRPFDKVCFNLSRSCGAIPSGSFLANEYDDIDLDYHNLQFATAGPTKEQKNIASSSTSVERGSDRGLEKDNEASTSDVRHDGLEPSMLSSPSLKPLPSLSPGKPLTRADARNILHQTCFRLSGSAEALHFETVQEDAENYGCILTIRSLNGTSTRTYRTSNTWSSQFEAKCEAARIAVGMGALDFIRTGEADVQKHKKAELIERAKVEGRKLEEGKPVDRCVQEIEECCVEWRAGRVQPCWVWYRHPSKADEWGAALRIALTPHQLRVYSTDATFASKDEAKASCARQAVEDGVLEYIKFGNGQKAPPPKDLPSRPGTSHSQRYSLQEYFETLPRPFPVDVGHKSAHEFQAASWLNSMIQHTKIPQFKTAYYYTNSDVRGGGGLSGCVLRLEGPKHRSKAYILDPHFAKRQDAKAAVCLLAISQNVQAYVQSVEQEFDKKLGPGDRVLVETKILPAILARAQKVRAGNRPKYDFVSDEGGFGCTLSINISPDEENPDIRTYIVEPEYRTKTDAKQAVSLAAAKAGLIDLMAFGSQTLPEGYRSFWSTVTGSPVVASGMVGGNSMVARSDSGQSQSQSVITEDEKRKGKKRKRAMEEKDGPEASEELGEIVEHRPSKTGKNKNKNKQAPSTTTSKAQKKQQKPWAGAPVPIPMAGPPIHFPYHSQQQGQEYSYGFQHSGYPGSTVYRNGTPPWSYPPGTRPQPIHYPPPISMGGGYPGPPLSHQPPHQNQHYRHQPSWGYGDRRPGLPYDD